MNDTGEIANNLLNTPTNWILTADGGCGKNLLDISGLYSLLHKTSGGSTCGSQHGC